MAEPEALKFMEALCVASGDLQVDNRLDAVRDTYIRSRTGDMYTGANTLAEYFPQVVVLRVRKWTKIGTGAYGGDIGPDGKPLTDIGNAERFGEVYEGVLLHCDDEGVWYGLEGDRWQRDRENKVYLQARVVIDDFRKAANNPAQNKGNTTVDQWLRHAVNMGSAKSINAMINLSKALLPVVPEAFDSHPLLLNVQNGTLELDIVHGRVTLRAHRSEDMLTMMAPVSYDPDARHDLFEEYLELFHPDRDLRDFLQLHAGYLLTGLSKRFSLELIGPTHSGKSMALLLFANVLGDYAASLTYDSLMKSGRGGDIARPDLWRVRNKRLVTVAEVPPDVHYDVALFKTLLSGGDAKHVRDLYGRGTDVRFRFALWTSGNKPYGPPSSEAAAYERLHIYRCDQQMPADKRLEQRELDTINPRITGDAILAWMVRGFIRLYTEFNGEIIPPEKVRRSTAEIQDVLDPWTEITERLFVVTNDPADGVLKSEAWLFAKTEREKDVQSARHKPREQYDFEGGLERRVGPAKQSDGRWRNNRHWPGLRWSEFALETYRVSLPDWS
jgi:putative DNA primase/helicase